LTVADCSAVAAVAQIVAAGAAVLGLVFGGFQIRAARNTADVQHLMQFVRDVSEREHALLRADKEATKTQAFYELANFLEVLAASLNAGLMPKISRKIIHEKLVDSIAVITEEPSWHSTLFDGVTSPTTFAELAKFMRREKPAIEGLVKARAAAKA
jgi:hypothetical protein